MTLTQYLSRLPSPAQACLMVAALDVVGGIVAISAGLAGAGRTVVSGSALNAPLPFLIAQLLVAAVATRSAHRRLGVAAAALLVAMGLISVLSGLGDGSYTRALTAAERSVQVALVAITVLMTVSAGALVAGARRYRTA